MSIIFTKSAVAFTPAEYEAGDPAAPVYLLTPPTIATKAAWRAALTRAGVRQVTDDQVNAELKLAIGRVYPDDAVPALLDLVARYEEERAWLLEAAKRDDFSTDDIKAEVFEVVAEIEREVLARDDKYASLIADRQFFNEICPIVAAQHFLAGGENTPAPIERRGGLVTDACLNALPESHVRQIGWKAIGLMSVDKEQEKNSGLPSGSPAAPSSSTAESAHQTAADGKSADTTTSETPS